MTNLKYPFQLEPLPYDYSALEPAISAETMHLHHDKHLATYIEKLNTALESNNELQEMTLEELLSKPLTVPNSKKTEIKNNAGGVYNHILMFHCMKPYGDLIPPNGIIEQMIEASFGSFETCFKQLIEAALTQFGSGYGYLVKDDNRLKIIQLPNQDTPLSFGQQPLLPIDVWEHAYYLQYQNRRIDYLNSLGPVINWDYINALLAQ